MTRDKAALRRGLLKARRELGEEASARSSAEVLARVRDLPEWAKAREVMLYWPLAGEVDIRPLLAELTGRGACVLLPRCQPGQPGDMDAAPVTCEDDLCLLSHGIMEPDPARCPVAEALSPDLILIPALAYDRTGRRLGFGGGYYDRFLARPECTKAVKVGVCHAFQLVDELPAAPWDQGVDIVLTDRDILRLK